MFFSAWLSNLKTRSRSTRRVHRPSPLGNLRDWLLEERVVPDGNPPLATIPIQMPGTSPNTSLYNVIWNGGQSNTGIINVNSTANFPAPGSIQVQTSKGLQTLTYSSLTSTSFVDVSQWTGTISTNAPVTLLGGGASTTVSAAGAIFGSGNPGQSNVNTLLSPDNNTGSVVFKTLTITNNSPSTIYPILRDPNTGQYNATYWYDPQDPHKQDFREYIGYMHNGAYELGLPAGATIVIEVPVVFWDSANMFFAQDGTNLIPDPTPQNPNPTNPFLYFGPTQSGQVIPGNNGQPQALVYDVGQAPVTNQDGTQTTWVVSYTPNPSDPNQKGDTGGAMFYRNQNPVGIQPDAPAQLTEYTIRDIYLNTAFGIPTASGQTFALVNYDVSYVNDQIYPITMEATNVPVVNGGGASTGIDNYGFAGANLTPAQMTLLMQNFTSNTSANGLGQYFGGQGWPSYIGYPDQPAGNLKIPSGANIFGSSPFNGALSTYNTYGPNNQFMLTSGGTTPVNGVPTGVPIQGNSAAGGPNFVVGNSAVSGQVTFSTANPLTQPSVVWASNPLQRTNFFTNLGLMWTYSKATGQPINFFLTTVGPANNLTQLGTLVNYTMGVNGAPDTFTVQLNGTLPANLQGGALMIRPNTDYAATAINNLWYSWAQYYVSQMANLLNGATSTTWTGSITRANGNNVLNLDPGFDPTKFAVGMTVTGNGIPTNTDVTNVSYPATILGLGFGPDATPGLQPNQVLLSQVATADSPSGTTFTFGLPQPIAGAAFAATKVTSTASGTINVTPNSTAGFPLAGIIQVATSTGTQTLSYTGLTSSSFTGVSAWTGTISANASVTAGSTGLAQTTTTASATGSGTINVASTAGFPITGSLQIVSSTGGIQTVTYNGLTGTQFQNVSAWTGTISANAAITAAPPLGYTFNPYPIAATAQATQFAASVYEAMSAEYGAIINQAKLPNPLLPVSMNVVYTTIGGDLTHLPNKDPKTVGAEVRDLIKSILRGVYNFNALPENTGLWYPNPATMTGGQPFNVYNLDPFVWFIHTVENQSGYGFSLDDDSADINANFANGTFPTQTNGITNNLSFAFSGTGGLPNQKEWFASTNYGYLSTQGNITTTTTQGGLTQSTITLPNMQPVATGNPFWKVKDDDFKNAVVGAYITGPGIIPGTRIAFRNSQDPQQFILSAPAVGNSSGQYTFNGAPPKDIPNLINNGSFETPKVTSITTNPPGFLYGDQLSGSSWTFTPGNTSVGIATNGSAFTGANPDAPQGIQVAFLQGAGKSISQQISVPLIKNHIYQISFYAAQRATNTAAQSIEVTVTPTGGGTPLLDYTGAPPSSNYSPANLYFLATQGGTYTLTFTGKQSTGDSTAFIDNVQVIGSADASALPMAPPPPFTSSFTDLGGSVSEIATTTNAVGTLTEFGIGGDNAVWYRQENPGDDPTSFGPWTSLGGYAKALTVVPQGSGQPPAVFVIGGDNAAWFNLEDGSGWHSLGGFVKQLAAGLDGNGDLELFGVGGDNAVYVNLQSAPGSTSFSGWNDLGGYITQLAVAQNGGSVQTLQVFGIGGDGAIWTNQQTDLATPGTYSGWNSLGGFVKQFTVGQNQDGTLQLFAVGGNNAAYTNKQTTVGNVTSADFTGWNSLGGYISDLTVAQNSDGTLQFFGLGGDNAVWSRTQSTPGAFTSANFSAYQSFGGFAKQVVAATNPSTLTDQFFVIGGDNAVYTEGQNVLLAQKLDGTPLTDSGAATLTADELAPIVTEAEAQWEALGVSASQFAGLQFNIAPIAPGWLGAYAPGTITIDPTADGYGWLIDPTPGGSAAADHVDLLTVVMHELGHVLGLGDVAGGTDIMAETLAAGVRRAPTMADVDAAFRS